MPQKYYQGKFTPKNPKKYLGNPSNIIFRSGWEYQIFTRMDNDPSVVKWGSEEFFIPYFNPIDEKIHRYFPDIYLENTEGDKIVLEIKPDKYTRPPATPKRKTKRFLEEAATWAINDSKWKAARNYCKERGMHFVIGTEKNMNIVI
jgi:hypothetical protein